MIYADYNGSAPLCDDVKNYLINRIETGPFANPNAIHYLGTKCLMGMENSRAVCAKVLGAKPKQIIFNSGATEGISQVFYTLLHDAKEKNKPIFITTGIEHSAIFNCGEHYQELGLDWKILPIKEDGIVDMDILKTWLEEFGDKVSMVTAMAANNETGIIQPMKEISELCQKHNVPYLCDTTQYIGKTPFNFEESGIDYAVMSGHKVGAMTGAGFLIAKDPTSLKTLIIGGGQEKGIRGGTQNYLGNETIAVALDSFAKNSDKLQALEDKRIAFESELKKRFPEIVIIGENSPRLASTTYVAYPGIHGQCVQIELESQDIFVTTSSACSDNEPVTSKVLKSMNVTDDVGRGVVRISLGLSSPLEYYDKILEVLTQAYEKLGKIKSY
jgi:cysteine desulfurase